MQAADIGPVRADDRHQSGTDLFLIYAGANIVATTLVTGASLVPAFGTHAALVLIAAGSVLGAALVAALAPLGPRFGVPSVVVARAALGVGGAKALAVLLFVTNFAWIALNNVIAASACASVLGGPGTEQPWAVALGLLAALVVALGPKAVGRADRVAVPAMAVMGIVAAVRALTLPEGAWSAPGDESLSPLRGLDVVVGYQVSWILMFADYSRYTRSERKASLAVFLGLALTSLWFMPVGLLTARVAGGADPGAMMATLGLGFSGALLMALATVTTNFVNIYLSALALKSLAPRVSSRRAVWSIGGIGAALSLVSRAWLDRYADFMLALGGVLVPVGGILLARFFVQGSRALEVDQLYAEPCPFSGAITAKAIFAWALGAAAYFAAQGIGGTLPSLGTAMIAYLLLTRKT